MLKHSFFFFFFTFWYTSKGIFPQIKCLSIWMIIHSKFNLAKLLAIFFSNEFQILCASQYVRGERWRAEGRQTAVQARLRSSPSPRALSRAPSFTCCCCCCSPFSSATSLRAGCSQPASGTAAEQLWAAAGGSLPCSSHRCGWCGDGHRSPSLPAL